MEYGNTIYSLISLWKDILFATRFLPYRNNAAVNICVSLLILAFLFLWDRFIALELFGKGLCVALIFIVIPRLLSQKAINSYINISSVMKVTLPFPFCQQMLVLKCLPV